MSLGTATWGGEGEFFEAWGSRVTTVIIGARNEEQLRQNLGAADWTLSRDHVARLDAASAVTLPHPYWHQRGFVSGLT